MVARHCQQVGSLHSGLGHWRADNRHTFCMSRRQIANNVIFVSFALLSGFIALFFVLRSFVFSFVHPSVAEKACWGRGFSPCGQRFHWHPAYGKPFTVICGLHLLVQVSLHVHLNALIVSLLLCFVGVFLSFLVFQSLSVRSLHTQFATHFRLFHYYIRG